jgi:hypothetical protein
MKRGALHDPNHPSLASATSLETVLIALPDGPVPDWFEDCPADGDALLNDELGCCSQAAIMRLLETWACDRRLPWPNTAGMRDMVELRYREVAGYDGTPETDLGTIPAVDCFAWQTVPILDLDGREWRAFWITVPLPLLNQALRRGPLLVTLGLLTGEDDPDGWAEPLVGTPVEFHRVVAGAVDGDAFTCRTYGIDVPVHRSRIVAADLMVPHPDGVDPDLRMAGIEFGRLTQSA